MMIMKKSVLLFISLFPLSVLANPASSNAVESSLIRQVSVDTPYIDAKLPKGAVYTKIKSNVLSLNIPKGLSVDAYPLTDFRGDVVKYAPGQHADLINIQSIKVTEELLEKPLMVVKFNEGRYPDSNFCIDVEYKNLDNSSEGRLDLGEFCSGVTTTLLKSIPEGLKDGDRVALVFSKNNYNYGVLSMDFSDEDGLKRRMLNLGNGATGSMFENGVLLFNLRRLQN